MDENVADGGLIDVSQFSLADLLDEVDESSLAMALERICVTGRENVGQNGFESSI